MLDAFKNTLLLIIVLLAFLVLLTLGAWQSARLTWKENLISHIEKSIDQEPVALNQALLDMVDDKDAGWLYKRISLSGYLEEDTIRYVIPRTRDGVVGAQVLGLLDLQLSDDTDLNANGPFYIWADLGWVEKGQELDAAALGNLNFTDQIFYLQMPPAQGYFQPDNDFNEREIYWSDIEGLNNYEGVLPEQTIAAIAYNLEPISGMDNLQPHSLSASDLPNNHRKYAIFWFSMAVILLFFSVYYVFREKKETPNKEV